MAQFLIPLSNLLHTLATVLFIGHYLLLILFYIPVLSKQENGGLILSEISKRSRLWLYVAFGIFALTGVYLTLVDPYYQGIGQFKNMWSVLMLAKHILIVVIIVAGFWYNAVRRVGSSMLSTSGSASAIARFRSYCNLMATCGVLVLVLTAISQVI